MQTSYRALQLVITLIMTNAPLSASSYTHIPTNKVRPETVHAYTIIHSWIEAMCSFERMRQEHGSTSEHLARINQEQASCMSSYYEIEPNHAESPKRLEYLKDRIFYFSLELTDPIELDNRSPEHFWGIKTE